MEQEMVCDSVRSQPVTRRLEQNRAPKVDPNWETTLIKAAQQGSVSAFNQLVLAHQDDLFGWVSALVWDEATAEDITQQTFVTAYQKIVTFRGGSFRAWLFRIARNLSFDEMRYQWRHPTVRLDNDCQDEDSGDLLSILPADLPSPEEAVIQAEQANRVQRLLEILPQEFRQALELVDLYEMDYQEAAAVLNLPLGTLKSRVARARRKLRDLMVHPP